MSGVVLVERQRIGRLLVESPKASAREIAREVRCSRATVAAVGDLLIAAGIR